MSLFSVLTTVFGVAGFLPASKGATLGPLLLDDTPTDSGGNRTRDLPWQGNALTTELQSRNATQGKARSRLY